MKSKVYFSEIKDGKNAQEMLSGLKRLIEPSSVFDCLKKDDKAAVKMHFGEVGNTGYIKPAFVRAVTDALSLKGAKPFLSDTNTLYKGRRTNSKDHLALAREHGFLPESTGANLIIPEDSQPGMVTDIKINQKLIKTAKISSVFINADALIVLSHFKGHIMTSFGGALKNVGMGCAARQGKLAQHCDVSPVILKDKCIACGACVSVCQPRAIYIPEKAAVIDAGLCVGCASCIAACPFGAVEIDWGQGAATMSDKMIEYAKAVLDRKKGKAAFVNFVIKITKECDCLAKDDPGIAPDIGIFASNDPVSIDKASYDAVLKAAGRDVFEEAHPQREGIRQLDYAAELGLGSLDYELIEV
ncbi:MAG: DUF362 domain-containing protein [Candidatus Omnitrophota bacterium]